MSGGWNEEILNEVNIVLVCNSVFILLHSSSFGYIDPQTPATCKGQCSYVKSQETT